MYNTQNMQKDIASKRIFNWKWIYVRKSRDKKFLEKNLEIKTLEKSLNFIKSLEKMSPEIKSCVLDSWDFFS